MSRYKWEHGRLSKLKPVWGSQCGGPLLQWELTCKKHVFFGGGGFCLDHVPEFGGLWTCNPLESLGRVTHGLRFRGLRV